MKEDLNQRCGGLDTEHHGGDGRIRPYILCAIFGVVAVPIAILRFLIEVWDRGGPSHVDRGAGQQGRAQVQKYPS